MSVNRPESEEGVVLRGIAEVVKAAEEVSGPWPELDEPKFASSTPETFSAAEKVTLWTMAGLLGAVTIYAIATNDRQVLLIVLAIAVGTLLRLTRLKLNGRTPRKKNHGRRSKKQPSRRTKPRSAREDDTNDS